MVESEHHVDLVKGISEQLKTIMLKSEQAIYIYLDDNHKACNKKFAELLGYKSAKEWADMDAPLADVIEADQPAVIAAYETAMEKMVASCLDTRVKNVKTGKVIKTKMILVPIAFEGHLFSLHFLSKV